MDGHTATFLPTFAESPSPAASTIPGMDHAGYASKLLESAHALEEELAGLTPEKRLQLAATGRIAAVNADLRFTIDLAAAHALTAIAHALEQLNNR